MAMERGRSSSVVAGKKLSGSVTRALDAYRSWSGDASIDPLAPGEHLLRGSGPGDDAAVAILREHDPLGGGATFAVADLAIDPDAIVLAELIVAASITTQNVDAIGDRYVRMERFVYSREADIFNAVGAGTRFNAPTVLGQLVDGWSESQRMLLLIEVAASNPFAPFDIAWVVEHELNALAYLATVVGLPASAAQDVASTFTEATSAHRQISAKQIGLYGVGAAAALGGAGFLAAPAVGAAMGTAAGLSGAAATSYGLGLLGSIGGASVPGTFTAGGMWLVAQAGATAGALAGAGGSLLYSLGASQAQNEVIKLQVTYKLILIDLQRNDAAALDVLGDLEHRISLVVAELEDHLEISDPESAQVADMKATVNALKAADEWMDEQLEIEDDGGVLVRTSRVAGRLSRMEEVVRKRSGDSEAGDELLECFPASSRSRVEDRIRCRFALAAELDRWDVIAAVGAGIAGAAIDAWIIGDPSGPLTSRLRAGAAVRGDNWLAKLAKVPYDPSIAPGMTPNTHRALTPGHDPLLGLVIGTRDILQSTMTRSDVSGAVQFVDRPTVESSTDLFSALVTQVAHLMSDVVTPAGLPLPGWTALTTLSATSDAAVKMYAKGYDTWHLAPMSVTVAAVHAATSAYWAVRDVEGGVSDERGEAVTVLALGIASIGDLGSMLATGGNPLSLNYAMWLDLARRTAKQIRRQSQRSALVTLDDAERNRQILNHGWSVLLGR